MPLPPPCIAELTPRGRGAVATIAYQGDPRRFDSPTPLFSPARGGGMAGLPVGQLCYGRGWWIPRKWSSAV
ncbi:MAG: hypothetical protein R3B90_11155 [Planctomycetaceae bacterium]